MRLKNMRLTGVMAACILAVFSTTLSRARDGTIPPTPNAVAVSGLVADGVGNQPIYICARKCVEYSNCPAGTTLINSDGNISGCTNGTQCKGKCTACAGSANYIKLCTSDPNNTQCCNANGDPLHVDCGFSGSADCYKATQGGDGNGCACRTPGFYNGRLCLIRGCTS